MVWDVRAMAPTSKRLKKIKLAGRYVARYLAISRVEEDCNLLGDWTAEEFCFMPDKLIMKGETRMPATMAFVYQKQFCSV